MLTSYFNISVDLKIIVMRTESKIPVVSERGFDHWKAQDHLPYPQPQPEHELEYDACT